LTSTTCSPASTQSPAPGCQSTCTTNADCADPSHYCHNTGTAYVCRLATNPGSTSCQPPTTTLPSPTPTASCQQACTTNADCGDASHICFNTGSGNVCRLATNPNNTSCAPGSYYVESPAGGVVTKGGTAAPGQPALPEELPQSGAGDIIKWLGPGIGALLVGALVLFLL
jgi:hypothetical protein